MASATSAEEASQGLVLCATADGNTAKDAWRKRYVISYRVDSMALSLKDSGLHEVKKVCPDCGQGLLYDQSILDWWCAKCDYEESAKR